MTRVLIVEDEPDLADPLAYLLRREGFEVEIAEDGPAALTAFEARGADIVLLDLAVAALIALAWRTSRVAASTASRTALVARSLSEPAPAWSRSNSPVTAAPASRACFDSSAPTLRARSSAARPRTTPSRSG